ncbi:transcriptional regulator with GAF, ATPase, and Fis domain [Catalinimonas alkaloidigena]|uniref:GAF domain-containing protein n=1 Tax=Catalinimonas alkaloidigena TaxID=1075417 RepID=UPI0024056FAD|nr:GAF domain-containing protein [Catalinimonas alkaloidigena]MDF9799812.1 transcriptional regulator with GAF, ATPase, and Fis domain [Catalinimonas alkaloidigena]
MQAITKRLGFTFTILFFVGVAFSAYTLYQLPDQMMQAVPAVDLNVVGQLQPILFRLHLIAGITALLGLSAATVLISDSRVYKNQVASKAKNFGSKEQEHEIESTADSEKDIFIDQEAIEKILSSEDDMTSAFNKALSVVCKALEASQATAYISRQDEDSNYIELFASYAYHLPEGEKKIFRYGEGLAGQVAKEGNLVNINAVPEGYIQIISGLGGASPRHLIIIPLKEADEVIGVVEIASFHAFTSQHESALLQTFDKLTLKLVNDDNVSLEKAKR